jgi:hypothetical protein
MTCHEVREKTHDYLDGLVPTNQVALLEEHLKGCQACRQNWEDLAWTRDLLAVREYLPDPAREHIWREVHAKASVGWRMRLSGFWDDCRSYWRDLDRGVIWSKLSATPVTLGFFILILMQFPIAPFQDWTYPVISERRLPSSVFTEPEVTEAQGRHSYAEIDELSEAAWKLPYEDSFSLLAAITPEGHAEIDYVLEYPKSRDLLAAVDENLRTSQFELSSRLTRPLLIYSFQKIDVYSDRPDL